LPCAWAARTRSSPSNVTRASICCGVIVLNFKKTVSSRPKCENIPRAIARHSARLRSGKAAWRLRMARRRWGPSNQ
jgi:hypothetical protein